jgi:hypothetical protein
MFQYESKHNRANERHVGGEVVPNAGEVKDFIVTRLSLVAVLALVL